MSEVPLRLDRILHGGDYNPEQWPREVWDEDVRLMGRAGVNIATLPVFGWAAVNPAEGVFTFGWLDDIIGRLHGAGIGICLATATGATPAWVDEQYPEVRMVDDRGVRRLHGGRHAFCPSSPDFRRLSGALVEALAKRYGHHPAVKLWHLSNEYGGNWPNYCHCPRCAEGFRGWLRQRHGSLEGLNAAWTMAFWGHQLSSWSQVEPPLLHGERSVPAHLLDWRRFQSEQLLDCLRHEKAVLRAITPHLPVTTNLMGAFFALDYHAWAKELDVVSWDSYPAASDPWTTSAFHHALMRGLKGGQPFLLMEQSPSQQNWAPVNRLKAPGRLRLQSFQALAQGADSVMYFQWRQSRGGVEAFHGAVVEHHGRSDARVFREVSALGAELAALGTATLDGRVVARAAILFDWESWWAQRGVNGISPQLDAHQEAIAAHRILAAAGIGVDVVDPECDLDGYDLIIAPAWFLVRSEHATAIARRVAAGATLVATYATGVVDACDRVHEGGAPGPLAGVLGLRVEEMDGLAPGEANQVHFTRAVGAVPVGATAGCHLLCARIWLEGAVPVAVYDQDFYAGEPAISVNHHGAGQAWYLGTKLAEPVLTELLHAIARGAGLGSALAGGAVPPAGVEVMERQGPGGRLLYVLNHGTTAARVDLMPGSHRDLLTGAVHAGSLDLAPLSVHILA